MYLDTSVLVALLRDEADSHVARQLVTDATTPLIVSDFAAGEVASALSRLVRTGEVELALAIDRLGAFDDWRAAAATPLEVRPQDVRLAERLARRFELGIKMPDAVHLAICQSRDLKLATFDSRLAWVAEALGVAVARH